MNEPISVGDTLKLQTQKWVSRHRVIEIKPNGAITFDECLPPIIMSEDTSIRSYSLGDIN